MLVSTRLSLPAERDREGEENLAGASRARQKPTSPLWWSTVVDARRGVHRGARRARGLSSSCRSRSLHGYHIDADAGRMLVALPLALLSGLSRGVRGSARSRRYATWRTKQRPPGRRARSLSTTYFPYRSDTGRKGHKANERFDRDHQVPPLTLSVLRGLRARAVWAWLGALLLLRGSSRRRPPQNPPADNAVAGSRRCSRLRVRPPGDASSPRWGVPLPGLRLRSPSYLNRLTGP